MKGPDVLYPPDTAFPGVIGRTLGDLDPGVAGAAKCSRGRPQRGRHRAR